MNANHEAYLQQLIDNPPKAQKIATSQEELRATLATLRADPSKTLRSWVDPSDLRLHISAV
jgi:hypothetical protein